MFNIFELACFRNVYLLCLSFVCVAFIHISDRKYQIFDTYGPVMRHFSIKIFSFSTTLPRDIDMLPI